eukprot:gene5884-3253_t
MATGGRDTTGAVCRVQSETGGTARNYQYCRAVYAKGPSGAVFPLSGYAEYFTTNITDNMLRIRALRDGDWIDGRTRAVMVDFTFFNTNVRLLAANQIIFEWLPTGMVVSRPSIKPIEVMAQETTGEILALIIESLLAFCLIGFLGQKYKRFRDYW